MSTIDEMVNRFLAWKLPADFSPDGGVSFSTFYEPDSPHWPTGTNLLTAQQAKGMFTHALAGDSEHAEGCELGAEVSRRLDAEREARTLRCRFGVASGWIVAALKVLDTLDPEDTHEADELQKLVKAGEMLALTTLACSKTPNRY